MRMRHDSNRCREFSREVAQKALERFDTTCGSSHNDEPEWTWHG